MISLVGTLGSCLGGVAAHLLTLVLAPAIDSVRQQFYPPPPPPPPDPLIETVTALSEDVRSLSLQVSLLSRILEARDQPIVYDLAVHAVPHPRRERTEAA